MRICWPCLLILCVAASASGQQPASLAARFEVASLRPTAPILNQVNVGVSVQGQQVHITALPLSYYIAIAYGTKVSRISGTANLQDRFDLAATFPEGVKPDQLGQMMQGLLAERFQLKFHRESREMLVYVITAGKSPLGLREAAETPGSGQDSGLTAGGTGSAQGISLNLGNGSSFTFANDKWEARKLTFEQVADQMEQFVDRPIVDQTNLKGRYDFKLDLTPEDYQTMRARASVKAGFPLPPQIMQRLDTAQVPSLFEAFEKLGLKLEGKKVSQPVIVIDSILKTPTEN